MAKRRSASPPRTFARRSDEAPARRGPSHGEAQKGDRSARTSPRRSAKGRPFRPDFFTAKRERATVPPGLLHGEARKGDHAARTSPRRSGKARKRRSLFRENSSGKSYTPGAHHRRPRGAFGKNGGASEKNGGASGEKTARRGQKPFPTYIGARKAFGGDEKANFVTKRRREERRFVAGSYRLVRRFVAEKTLLFAPKRAKLTVPTGKAPAPKPRASRAASPAAVTGPEPRCLQPRPLDRRTAPLRPLERSLWVPTTTEPFREAPRGKPQRENEERRKTLETSTAPLPTLALTRTPPDERWEGSQPKRPERRGKPKPTKGGFSNAKVLYVRL